MSAYRHILLHGKSQLTVSIQMGTYSLAPIYLLLISLVALLDTVSGLVLDSSVPDKSRQGKFYNQKSRVRGKSSNRKELVFFLVLNRYLTFFNGRWKAHSLDVIYLLTYIFIRYREFRFVSCFFCRTSFFDCVTSLDDLTVTWHDTS